MQRRAFAGLIGAFWAFLVSKVGRSQRGREYSRILPRWHVMTAYRCRHDWYTGRNARYCLHCSAVEVVADSDPLVQITDRQAAALGFERAADLQRFGAIRDFVNRRSAA